MMERSQSTGRMLVGLTGGLAIACLLGATDADAWGKRSRSFRACETTTSEALQACKHDVVDDYHIELAKCANIADGDERKECTREADYERWPAFRECWDQKHARRDLCGDLGQAPYDPEIDPDDFVDPSDIPSQPNPYLPLLPGAKWVYEGDGELVTVTVTGETKEILGVECVVVRDVVEEDGELIEDTLDWFAQDRDGNVWYFGEIAKNYEDGEFVDIEGSWTAGEEGARPGIVMFAAPEVGDVYRQEFAVGDAEDAAEVLSVTATESAPAASCNASCVQTRDFTPLEPDTEEHKYYAPDVGLILEVDTETGDRVELIEVTF